MSSERLTVSIERRIAQVRLFAPENAPRAISPPSCAETALENIEKKCSAEERSLLFEKEIREKTEAARREALDEGRRLGREEARRELSGLAALLERACAEARARTLEEIQEIERRLPELALAIAERILNAEIASGRIPLGPALERAIAKIRERADVLIRLHPSDCALLADKEKIAGPHGGSCRFVADPAIERGGFVIETPGGRIAHSIREEIARVRQAIETGEAN